MPFYNNNNQYKISPDNIKGKIEFKNVTFSYPTKKMDEFNISYELIIYTRNILYELFNYKINYYSFLNNSIDLRKKIFLVLSKFFYYL